jgi:hypothetical protein
LQFGVCLLQQAREIGAGTPAAEKLWKEAAELFGEALRLIGTPAEGDKRATRVRAQAEVRLVQVVHFAGDSEQLLTAVQRFRPNHAGTVEELILLSFSYHAYRQRGEADNARATRDRMRVLFDKLKEKPDAFPAKSGEYSRKYWDEVWFAEK